jgi:hypothetical protein
MPDILVKLADICGKLGYPVNPADVMLDSVSPLYFLTFNPFAIDVDKGILE